MLIDLVERLTMSAGGRSVPETTTSVIAIDTLQVVPTGDTVKMRLNLNVRNGENVVGNGMNVIVIVITVVTGTVTMSALLGESVTVQGILIGLIGLIALPIVLIGMTLSLPPWLNSHARRKRGRERGGIESWLMRGAR